MKANSVNACTRNVVKNTSITRKLQMAYPGTEGEQESRWQSEPHSARERPHFCAPLEENKRNGHCRKVLCRDFPIELQHMYQRFRRGLDKGLV